MTETEEKHPIQGVPSTLAIRNHPIHPALVDFPIALLTAAAITDVLFWQSGSGHWAEFSFWLILGGWLTGFIAVISGLVDFLTIARARAHAAGWLHFLLTDLAIFLSTFNLIARLDDRQDSILFTGLGLSVVVALSLLVAGYYGGRLVFAYLVGVYGPEEKAQPAEE